MCGIAGFIQYKLPFQREKSLAILHQMTDVLAHRGPDGNGHWISPDAKVALGHRRLSIVDLSPLGAQPMANEDNSIWVIFNGEIYNHIELRAELTIKGHAFRSQSDTEVLVHLYEELGPDLVQRLDGDFAFVLYDTKKDICVMARDPIGVKPLYYAIDERGVIFASEIKAILKHPNIRREIDEEGVYHYLTYLVVPAPNTMFKGIKKLRAGELIVIHTKACSFRKSVYWEPIPTQISGSEKNWDLELEQLFLGSVRKRLMSDVPVGLLFSGGVDSSLNTAAFKSLVKPNAVHTYNVSMSAPRFRDESGFAASVAECFGSIHNHVRVTEADLVGSIEDLVYHQDEPLADPVCLPLYYVTRLARRDGMTVLQAGEGADEIFCGYDNFRRFLRHERSLWNPLSRFPQWTATLAFHSLRHLSKRPKAEKIADVLRRRGLGQEFYLSEAVAFYEYEKQRVISPEFSNRMRDLDSFDIVKPFYTRLEEIQPNPSLLQKMTYIELRLRLPELLLMRSDKMSMANSVELRVPFLDKRLVNFALGVTQSYKLRHGVSKEPLKALATKLTEEERVSAIPSHCGGSSRNLYYRAKSGFGAPLQDWFSSTLGQDFRDRIKKNPEMMLQFFDIKPIEKELSQGAATVNRSFHMWVMYNLLVWRQKYCV